MKKIKVKITNCKHCGQFPDYFKDDTGSHYIRCCSCGYQEHSESYKVVSTWWNFRPTVTEKEIEMEVDE